MKVLHIAPNYPYSKLYHQLISALEDKGITDEVYVQSKEPEVERDYPVYYLGRNFGLIDRLLYFRKQKIILNDILRRNITDGVNVIHAHNLFSAGYCAYKVKKERGIPYVVAVRNTDVNDFFHKMIHLRPIGVNILREADAVVFLSSTYRDSVISRYVPPPYRADILKKCFVIPNGLDPYFVSNKALRHRELSEEMVVRLVYVGDINKNKNIGTTIKACNQLIKMGYNTTLDVVGRIKDKSLEYIKSLEFVNYHPYSPKEQVLDYLNHADIFVMPSITETFGLVYIEAMSQGLPVIYTQGQGFDGYYEEGKVGYHVPCFDHKAIADCVVKIIKNYSTISENCIKAVDDFSWHNKAEQYKNIYENLMIHV